MYSDAEVGGHLASLRERAGLKQAELARQVTWSPAVLSRAEAGERPLSRDELEQLLRAIGTDEALRVGEILAREWRILEQPPVGHLDQEILWRAELALRELADFAEKPEARAAFLRRLEEYRDELSRTARLLLTTDHHVAFIGSIGVGKSTALCRITGLEVPGSTTAVPSPVLEAGGGGVTICEVHVRQGPDYGLIVEPRSDEETRREVADFAQYLMTSNSSSCSTGPDSDEADSLGLSKEIVRAIRNMAGLVTRREKGPDGKVVRTDDAMQLAKSSADARALTVEILSRMKLHQRDRRDIWYSPTSGKEPLPWLKEIFEQVNNGRHPQFSIPQRIEVVVPEPTLGTDSLAVRLVDTRGIDHTAEREDLERHFDEPHTLSILCTAFNDAPAAAAQQLLRRATAAGIRHLPIKAAILVLPRPGEALAVKDDQGLAAESTVDGYDLKGDQVEMRLRDLKTDGMPIHFFNAREDEPGALTAFLLGRLEAIRDSYRQRLNGSIEGAAALIANFEKEQVREVQREAARRLVVWLGTHTEPRGVSLRVQDSLLEALNSAHASTIRATVRRDGDWWKLEYSHQLGHGARCLAAAALGPQFEEFRAIADNLLQDPELQEAWDLVQQAGRIMEGGVDEILKKVQLLGRAVHADGLKGDAVFWSGCSSEWGAGPGYKDRVAGRNVSWFEDKAHQTYGEQVHGLVRREWGQLLERLTPLLEVY